MLTPSRYLGRDLCFLSGVIARIDDDVMMITQQSDVWGIVTLVVEPVRLPDLLVQPETNK